MTFLPPTRFTFNPMTAEPDNPVSERTRRLWLETVLSWAEARLAPPQFDECKRALTSAVEQSRRTVDRKTEPAGIYALGECLQELSDVSGILKDTVAQREELRRDNARLVAAVEQARAELDQFTTLVGGNPDAIVPLVCDSIYSMLTDVWSHFHGVKRLDDSGLSVMAEVRYWLDHHADWDLHITQTPTTPLPTLAIKDIERLCGALPAGEWVAEEYRGTWRVHLRTEDDDLITHCPIIEILNGQSPDKIADFIVAARTVIPMLLSEYRRIRGGLRAAVKGGDKK